MTVPIFDTHQHLIYADRLRYSIADTVTVLQGRSFRYEDYVLAISGTGIDGSVFMETTPDQWDKEFELIYPLFLDPRTLICGIIAQGRPEFADGFQEWVEAHAARGLSGVRRVCHVEPDGFALQPQFVDNIRLLGSFGLPFDMCFLGRQLPQAVCLSQLCPNTQMVLDHCGVPDIAAGEWQTWKESIVRLAELPNVACKISGVLAYCAAERATSQAIRPYVEHCIEQFGWDRLVWGSDWPFCLQRTTLNHWVDVSRDLVKNEPLHHQEKLFSGNALRIYRHENIDENDIMKN